MRGTLGIPTEGRACEMQTPPLTPRIPPLTPSEMDDETRELLAGIGKSNATNIFATLVRHPGLFRRWAPFGGKLLAGRLPVRDRELLILRTGWHCRSEYEWGQHSFIAKANGFTDQDLVRIEQGPDAAGWSEFETVLLHAADELHHESCIAEDTWTRLSHAYDERQLIEVPMVVGHYHMVAFMLNSLGVQREPGVPGFA
jgi:4-carboxymuconolactone decarboxylase